MNRLMIMMDYFFPLFQAFFSEHKKVPKTGYFPCFTHWIDINSLHVDFFKINVSKNSFMDTSNGLDPGHYLVSNSYNYLYSIGERNLLCSKLKY